MFFRVIFIFQFQKVLLKIFCVKFPINLLGFCKILYFGHDYEYLLENERRCLRRRGRSPSILSTCYTRGQMNRGVPQEGTR
ncbi:LON peptidase N-terminal domain and RING finger protein 1 isoform X2 [Iris pallida]|uniref:LON peptidase N-terminal domain and RING finger protein 1 isoform X1 n=1 Tax=Iris pallida TaxID=29817 RepID=A0AAX6E1V7_IRIPA|nr:LON peptidase N-terminal domain and RING finger protein 1 isoform X1 [Iris pallida]KAJ6802960.1 LON peptidase N-terminal domain and RING finger protein 1 isoform X2 [Iris pallida]KAJ6807028.1 LON peptidase N-terminal domain and RING finger protein 1 isoform X2 [Iris pallida]